MRYNHITYTFSSYCLEPYQNLNGNEVRLNAHFCEKNHPVMITLNIICEYVKKKIKI
jgi:hypothetical protein